MHRVRSALRDELHSGGLLLAKPPTYHASAPAATTTAHFSSSPFLGGYQTDGSTKSCNFSQIQFPGEGLPLVDHDVLARSISYDMHHGMPHDTHNLPACSAISSPSGSTSNPAGGDVNQLLFSSSASPGAARTSSSGHGKLEAACSSSCGSPHQQQLMDRAAMPDGGWQLGHNLASSSHQQQQQLLAHAQQQQFIVLDALHMSSQPQATAASAPQSQASFGTASSAEQEWFEQLLAAAAMDSPQAPLAGGNSLQWPPAVDDYNSTANAALLNQQQQLLLQLQTAALQGGASSCLLSAPAAQLPNPMLQQVLQLQQQQQQQQQQQAQQLNAALTLAALGAQSGSNTANNFLAQQLLLNNPAAAAGMWLHQQANLGGAPISTNSLAAMAAGLNPQLACIAPALLHNQQLSAQLLAGQAGTAATAAAAAAPVSTALAQLLSAQLGNLIHQAGPAAVAAAAAAAAAASGASWGVLPGASMEPAAGFSPNSLGRSHQRSRRGSKTSHFNSHSPTPLEFEGRRGSSSSSNASKEAMTGGAAAAADDTSAIVLLPGMRLDDLSPDGFQDTWGADSPAADSSGDGHRRSEASVALSIASGCRSSSTASSSCSSDGALEQPGSGSPGSSICGGFEWDDGEKSPPPATAAAPPADAWGAAALDADDAASVTLEAAAGNNTSSSKVGNCPAWFPGGRELAGDDSWYLPLPPTSRLFVGNIGCWVDEAALLGYFGKYGNVVDVQVMWNTKMLARGRRVNREFAFISYSSPLEAARAVHWLDGCRLPDLEKDKNGVTVEYENGESDATGNKGAAPKVMAHAAH